MDTLRQKVFGPEETPKNVFVINDIDLRIPPTNIEVRKEDLTYQYRTLRTRSSTKLPTGNGQVSINLTIPFTDELLLDMHRLIVEIRNNPFCYVDNRYVRESIVPDWPFSQNMALTITGLSISNMPNASNAYVMQLDGLWFNYFPFMHNYLFREEWQTNPLKSGDGSNGVYETMTIGWKINPTTYNKEYYPNVIFREERHDDPNASVQFGELGRLDERPATSEDAWSLLQGKFTNTRNRTIYEMEANHPGVEFDLLPVPGNMQPSRLVAQPRYSKVYVRYINFLQRDALLKNFGIDVEADVIKWDQAHPGVELHKNLFNVGQDPNGYMRVIPLNSTMVPRDLRHKWIREMEQYNHGVKFNFSAYKEIRMPQKWTDDVDNRKNRAIADLTQRLSAVRDLEQINRGTSDGTDLAVPVLGARFPLTSPFGPRKHPVTGVHQQLHNGVDFGAPRGKPIYAPEPGTITQVRKTAFTSTSGNWVELTTASGVWQFCHMDTMINGVTNQPLAVGDKVIATQMIGTVGATGVLATGGSSVSGPHLHLIYKVGGKSVDPVPTLQRLLEERTSTQLANDEETYFDYTDVSEEDEFSTQSTFTGPLAEDEILKQHAVKEAEQKLALTPEESASLQDLLALLDQEGWSYYDEDSTVTNVWRKQLQIEVAHSGLDRVEGRNEFPEEFAQAGIILTGITGSISHLVAKIPILSHEYPTCQHLGSIEPEYQLEFAILDDQSNLEGISVMGGMVQGMRSLLMSNARKFRAVMDGWSVATDTFITRLLGSYQNNDFRQLDENGLIGDIKLRKRTLISSTYDGTVEGNPGLSTLLMNLQETNPYQQEKLVATSSGLHDKEESRRQVLQALYTLDLSSRYRESILPFFLAHRIGANLSDPSRDDYGKVILGYDNLSRLYDPNAKNYPDPFLYKEPSGKTVLLMRGSSPEELNVLRTLGLEVDYYGTKARSGDQFFAIDPQELDELLYYSSNGVLGNVTDSGDKATYEEAKKFIAMAPANMGGFNVYDIGTYAAQNPDLADIPLDLFMDYYAGLAALLDTGARMFAEVEVGGLPKDYISEELYGLPCRTDMWKSWQMYLEEFIKLSNDSNPSSALQSLHDNPAWPLPGTNNSSTYRPTNQEAEGWQDPLPEKSRPIFAEIAMLGFGPFGSKTAGIWDAEPTHQLLERVSIGVAAAASSSVDYATIRRQAVSTSWSRLIGRYMSALPLQVNLPDNLKAKYKFLIGDILGDVSESGGNVRSELQSMRDAFWENIKSCGNIQDIHTGIYSISNNPRWYSEDISGQTVRGGVIGVANNAIVGSSILPMIDTIAPFITASPSSANTPPINLTQGFTDYAILPSLNMAEKVGFEGATDYLFQEQRVTNPPGSPFKYPVEQGFEQVKVKYIKGLFAAFADDILSNYGLLELLGLEHLMFIDENRDYSGLECFPDMELPAHPYYGTNMSTYPDFYMWNIYEDGGALGPEELQEIYSKVYHVVENCYDSMKRMSKGDRYDERTENQIMESSVDDPMILNTEITPEGTDAAKPDEQGFSSGATSSPYAPVSAAKQEIQTWEARASASGQSKKIFSSKPGDYIEGIRLASTEGLYGTGGGVHYPQRTGPGVYEELRTQLQATKQLFGSSEGYLNSQLDAKNNPEIASSIEGTNLERPKEPAHTFDLDSLRKLAKDSAKDLISQKMSMKRAYPTLKLYFIEEDEFETRLINFDDFYSYNAIKEAIIVQSRKIAADTAVIQVQNISGSLDGTRRNAIVDLDYFSDTARKKLEGQGDQLDSEIGGNPITANTAQDQPFGSVVLRPGLNVQLRVGYSNDPNCLHVMLSGRVVDVTWNKTGDLAEITIQSFGAELQQAVKGTIRDQSAQTFYTTHELLGSMMLEPEVVHFGRWEFGQLFQTDEARDHRLDFTDYAKNGYLGNFKITHWFSSFVMNHPYITMGAALGATTVSLFPFGGWIRNIAGSGRFSSAAIKGLGRFGLGTEGELGYRAVFSGVAKGRSISLSQEVITTTTSAGKVRTATQTVSALPSSARASFAQTAKNLVNSRGTLRTGAKELQEVVAKKLALALDEIAATASLGADDAIAASAKAVAKLEADLNLLAFKGRWMAKPWLEVSGATFWTAFGSQPIRTLVTYYIGAPLALAAGTLTTAFIADAAIWAFLKPAYERTIGRARKFFTRTNVSLFLTPQDDNLYPPHPKDYMTLDRSTFAQSVELGLNDLSMMATQSNELGKLVWRFFNPDEFLSKRVTPGAAQYQLVSTKIWDVFREMSIRHPGWIYGARPYGKDFRYTMFFGLPAQRYWARPASNGFVTRANQLRKFLDNRADEFSDGMGFLINDGEFKNLYGQTAYEELKEYWERQFTADNFMNSDIPQEQAESDMNLRTQMTATAIKEYLRALEVRFEPFRRYHMVSSERDLVWNGMMGSEQAVINAVDITYTAADDTRADDFTGVIKTAVFKAHAFIPEDKLRIAPIRWPNCKGYGMAQRYAMGELLDRMKDMYRGEIIVLGNPRMRPWDIAILLDSYNDMVGPVEIEQVVHTISHETGYLTEIKPSAVCFANEISGWPMVEAMKLFAMAVHDVHNRYAGIKADNGSEPVDKKGGFGNLASIAGYVAGMWTTPGSLFYGPKFDSFLDEKYKRIFGTDGAQLSDVYGGSPPPDFSIVDGIINDTLANAKFGFNGIGTLGMATTLAGGVMAGGVAYEAVSNSTPITNAIQKASGIAENADGLARVFRKHPLAMAAGAAIITGGSLTALGYGGAMAINQIDFPGAAYLLGGNLLFLQCLRNDAIIVVPVIKSGHPIIAGLAYNDPSMIWNTFKGVISRMALDTINGTNDLIGLYKRYGSEIWRRIDDNKLGFWDNDNQNLSLTGD